ncbi:LysR family transcriptional regulator [Mobilicoccus pelagius]|uniref:Putative LysR family transcriptional regulator n=1 Tax=Mobilicoccus pelagius NBRC 104925 TaxID=1089455 RepID=H5UMN3_9MICO|nr:LysR family transcriptional regulator [Mobilicoccus pelagius]GAB46991.1 putative LysR family transcriptional regulator [Mobilicoccus pelagius NBRC 104925]
MTSRAPDVEGLALLTLVGRTGSLGAAARTLGLGQPNASRTLARLERDLGLTLVDRSPTGSRLTAHGRLVADWAEPVLTALDHLTAGAESLREDRASHLAVGASLTIGEHLVPRWLTRFRNAHPQVQVRVRVTNSADVVEAVEADTIDVGFVESPGVPASLQSLVVAHDELVVVVAPGHPWTRRTSVTRAELAETPLVFREPGSGTRDTVDELLADLDPADPVMELSSITAIVRSVAAGIGPSVVSAHAVADAVRDDRVRIVPLADGRLRRDLRAIWRPTRRLGVAWDFVLSTREPLPT